MRLNVDDDVGVDIARERFGGLCAVLARLADDAFGGQRLAHWNVVCHPIGLGLQVGLALFFSVFRLPSEQGVQDDLKSLVGFQRGAFAAFAAVAAPVAEEMFFRVLLLDALRRRLPVVVAVLAQGLLFGLVHYSSTTAWPVVAALAVVGIVLGTVFARGRSIWTCVAAHMAFNALAVVQLIG